MMFDFLELRVYYFFHFCLHLVSFSSSVFLNRQNLEDFHCYSEKVGDKCCYRNVSNSLEFGSEEVSNIQPAWWISKHPFPPLLRLRCQPSLISSFLQRIWKWFVKRFFYWQTCRIFASSIGHGFFSRQQSLLKYSVDLKQAFMWEAKFSWNGAENLKLIFRLKLLLMMITWVCKSVLATKGRVKVLYSGSDASQAPSY